jgi:hypothetical protein
LAIDRAVAKVDEYQVYVGSAAHQSDHGLGHVGLVQAACDQLGAVEGACPAGPELLPLGEFERHRLGRYDVLKGPPCCLGNTALLIFLASSGVLKMTPPRGPPSVLWVVLVVMSANRHRVRVEPRGYKAGKVGHVRIRDRAVVVGDASECYEVQVAGGGGCTWAA